MTIAEHLFVRRRLAVLAVALLAAASGTLLLVPAVHAQNVLDQYGDGDTGPGGGSGEGPGAGAGNEGGSLDLGNGDATGNLPFTGYPLTPLVLTLLVLLAIGTLVRIGIAVRDRVNARTASSGPLTPLE